eukprot:scaffold651936_cov43-Prasinocladus_malaysianus.AAC.1
MMSSQTGGRNHSLNPQFLGDPHHDALRGPPSIDNLWAPRLKVAPLPEIHAGEAFQLELVARLAHVGLPVITDPPHCGY